CCEDKMHCCPESTKCDLAHSKSVVGRAVTCPGGKSLCPDGTTCCLLASGDFGCCPYPEAVCCFDKLHCCPGNTTCDLEHEMCTSPNTQTPLAKKIPAIPNDVNAVPCNDSVACADGSTCCKSLDGEWVCCPLPKAVCCDDHLHCCPHGTICNLAESTCDDPSSGPALVPMLDKVPAFSYVSEEKPLPNTKCDESTSCPGQSTCCETTTGNWACCPLPNAMCCNDHLHCCPHGTVCNLEASTCDDPSGFTMPWVAKVPALATQTPLATEKCDEQTMCPRGTTCCRQNSGQSACCPLPHVVCCDDHEHCCPKGYTCNVAEQTCDKPGLLSLPWVPKLPGLPLHRGLPQASAPSVHPVKNMCDPHTSCPKDTTCCFVKKAGKWGCCPLPKAVCCADGDHCCPSSYSCDDQKTCCTKGRLTIPWYRKEKALTVGAMLKDVKCDNKSSCASGTTCCKLSTEEWGCCPLVKAVCCADAKHCCPMGYTCNLGQGGCSQQAELTWDIFFTHNKKRDFVPFGL
uniref:Granulins domain-containing protein n=1 Tax=Oncorhynchus tshawytscha TaxID=74940 RepID=A0AAZ3P7G7_ONCTS